MKGQWNWRTEGRSGTKERLEVVIYLRGNDEYIGAALFDFIWWFERSVWVRSWFLLGYPYSSVTVCLRELGIQTANIIFYTTYVFWQGESRMGEEFGSWRGLRFGVCGEKG